jgi:GDSL-like lipase/acylhydrolase family protein
MKWVGRAALAVFGLAMAALALEIGLRVLYPDVPIIRRDERFGSLARPNLDVRKTFGGHERVVRVSTNAFGLRGAELPSGKIPGLRRIVALGDSFTFGDAVEAEEAWPAQLEAHLNRDGSSARWQVINAGIPGHGTGQQLLLSRMLGERLRPDVVVLGFTVVNDVLDNLCVEEASYTPKTAVPCFVLDGDRLRLIAASPTDRAPARRPRLRVADFLSGQARRLALGHPGLLAVAGWSGMRIELPYVPATVASWYDPRYAEPGWRLTRRLLIELREQLDAERVPLVILVIPAALQVDPALQSTLRALGRRQPAVQEFLGEPARPQRLVGEFCRDARLACLDALPSLVESERLGVRTYYSIDNHWTPAAHALAADLVARRLLGLAGR